MLFSAMVVTLFSPSMLVFETHFDKREHLYFVGLQGLSLRCFIFGCLNILELAFGTE
jgi:hypothetical protein